MRSRCVAGAIAFICLNHNFSWVFVLFQSLTKFERIFAKPAPTGVVYLPENSCKMAAIARYYQFHQSDEMLCLLVPYC